MVHRLWLVAVVSLLALASMPRVVLAQETDAQSHVRYIEELKQRNAAYGPGCNSIGISVPVTVEVPADMTSRWAAGHSACVPGLRLVMTCAGEVAGDERVIGCMLRIAEGQIDRAIACEQLTLITPVARYTPDAALSDAMAQSSESGALSCSESADLSPGVTIAVPFHVPAETSTGDLAITIDIDGSEVPAFLIPAGQLSIDPASSP